jgi:hypothetical protein
VRKYTQNKVAESRLALPTTIAYAVVVWLLAGLVQDVLWLQFACFALAALLMVELNNINALIRIYSRMVSCSFIVMSCMLCFLFPSTSGAITAPLVVGSMISLFTGYQDKLSSKSSYYAFLLIGLASLAFVHILFFVPLIWLLMAFLLQCFSWRTWVASILGLLTPYWFGSCWWAWQQDFTFVFNHFMALGDFARPLDLSLLTVPQIVSLAVVMLFAVIGIVHYIRKYHDDKIRIRLIYGIFIWTDLAAALFLMLQPQHYDHLIRMMVINTAPLIGHFLALTRTRWTNMAFYAIVAIVLITTGFNLWM